MAAKKAMATATRVAGDKESTGNRDATATAMKVAGDEEGDDEGGKGNGGSGKEGNGAQRQQHVLHHLAFEDG
jgi:hypothetical protein